MGKYKICVYAICKDEAQFARRWMQSMSEADQVVVLDTGSTDGTPELLRSLGAQVTVERIEPWRFDVARNRSLALVPEDADVCVCTDLDEVFRPGWRDALEAVWQPEAGQATYRYIWSFQPDGSPGHTFWYEKIHSRRGWRWAHPVHEVLERTGEETPTLKVRVPGILLEHHPDPTKSRAQYLELLELSVREAPEDDRNLHYLGREYLFRGRWDDCIRTLRRHLHLPTATWAPERAASMRYIARAYAAKGQGDRALSWYLRAAAEAPELREPWVDAALFSHEQEDWDAVAYFTGKALAIKERPEVYICEAQAWGSLPWDLRAVALWHVGRREQALEAARQALALAPRDERLRKNVALMADLLER